MLGPAPAARQASFALSTRSRRSMDGASEPFLGNGSAEGGHEGSNNEKGLETTLNEIGFGAYQLRLLILCGCGWLSDNASLQSIALIIPRVQVHFGLSTTHVGFLSACMMAGMMVGSIAWGTLSDIAGRTLPFNATLALTAVSGVAASYAPTFPILCMWMFLLGSAVGGSMPTDGTLFLENLPEEKQYLLTLLSVFFSLGAVVTSVIGLAVLPEASCASHAECDFAAQENDGWRRLLFILGLVNAGMFAARFLLFRLHESPRFLVARDRPDEAVVVLKHIAQFNGNDMSIDRACVEVEVESVEEHGNLGMKERAQENGHAQPTADEVKRSGSTSPEAVPFNPRKALARGRMSSASPLVTSPTLEGAQSFSLGPPGRSEEQDRHAMYASLGVLPTPKRDLSQYTFHTPSEELSQAETFDLSRKKLSPRASMPLLPHQEEDLPDAVSPDLVAGEDDDVPALPGGLDGSNEKPRTNRIVRAAQAWKERMAMLFVPRWRRTTVLMWIIWGAMSLAYGMFNVWLPTVLEERAKDAGAQGLSEALREYVIYSVAGCPGSLIGAYSIESRLGRRKSLAIFTLCTALATFAFIGVSSQYAVIASSTVISVAATAMYAVLYGMTPEIFGIEIRGTACGTSAAISRLTGISAPLFAGFLLSIAPSLPLFTSAGVFAATAVCSLLLPFERVPGGAKSGGGMMH